MVNALIDISNDTNRILNIIKAKNGLRTKSEAIDELAREYAMEVMEPELRPDYVDRLKKIDKQTTIKVRDFEKEFLG